MANRYTRPVMFAFEPNLTHVFAMIAFGAAGAPSFVQNSANGSVVSNSKGLCNVSLAPTGLYTLTFGSQFTPFKRLDAYPRLVGLSYVWDETANAGAAPAQELVYLAANNISNAQLASLTLQTGSDLTGAFVAGVPASGEILRVSFQFAQSTAI